MSFRMREWSPVTRGSVRALVLVWMCLSVAGAVRAQEGASKGAGQVEDAASDAELPNFHRVNNHLYRGAQPQRGGLKKLSETGIRTIVNLRSDDEHAEAEEQEARSLGLHYVNIPMGRAGRPTSEQVERVLSIIEAPESQPVFVHCQRGADRTGTIIAIYRIVHDGWTAERALDEAEHYGMRFWQVKKKDFVRDFYRDRVTSSNVSNAPKAHEPAPSTKQR